MSKKTKLSGFTLILMLTACSSQPSVTTNNTSSNSDSNKNVQTEKNFHVKSFSYTSKDGPSPSNSDNFIPDTTPEKDLVLKDKINGKVRMPPNRNFKQYKKSDPTPAGLNWWAGIKKVTSPTNNIVGAFAGHQIQPTLNLPTGFSYELVLYAPTLMPPNNSIVESVTVYKRAPGGSMVRNWSIWDHKYPGTTEGTWVREYPMDSTWQSTYTGNYTDGQFYFTTLKKASSTAWRVLIYNFSLGTWEEKYSIDRGSTVSVYNDGWEAFEPKWTDYCHTLPSIKATTVQFFDGSSWHNNTPANGAYPDSGGLSCGNWTYTWLNNYYEWKVN